jgi:hypothetical protein
MDGWTALDTKAHQDAPDRVAGTHVLCGRSKTVYVNQAIC